MRALLRNDDRDEHSQDIGVIVKQIGIFQPGGSLETSDDPPEVRFLALQPGAELI